MSEPTDRMTRTDMGKTICQRLSPNLTSQEASLGIDDEGIPPTSNQPRSTAKTLIASAARKNVGSDMPIIARTVTV